MRLAACIVLLLASGPTWAQDALELPAPMVGHWETLPANCAVTSATEGQALFIEPSSISPVSWETEGGTCSVEMTSGKLPIIRVFANCSDEEGPQEAAVFTLVLPEPNTLAYADELYHRCD